jgi:hypothetical protein
MRQHTPAYVSIRIAGVAEDPPTRQARQRQYLYFCTSKASKPIKLRICLVVKQSKAIKLRICLALLAL